MDCEGCQNNCCKELPIYLRDQELKSLKEFRPDLKVKTFGNQHHIEPPCPLLDEEGKCSAYDLRPTTCRRFPLLAQVFPEDGIIAYAIFKDCEKWDKISEEDQNLLIRAFYFDQAFSLMYPIRQTLKERNKEVIYLKTLGSDKITHPIFAKERIIIFDLHIAAIVKKISGKSVADFMLLHEQTQAYKNYTKEYEKEQKENEKRRLKNAGT